MFGYKSKEYEKANNAFSRARRSLNPYPKKISVNKKISSELAEMFPDTLGYLYDVLSRVRRRYGSGSKAYRRVFNQINNIQHSALEATQGTLEFARDILLPLSSEIMKQERSKILKDNDRELKRAIRPFVVEAVINDNFDIDMDALKDITRMKINAERN